MKSLNGSAKYIIPSAAVLAVIIGLHTLQQNELGAVRDCSEDNRTAVARVEERTTAQFDEILRRLEAIDKKLP